MPAEQAWWAKNGGEFLVIQFPTMNDPVGKSFCPPFFKGRDPNTPFSQGGRAQRGGILASYNENPKVFQQYLSRPDYETTPAQAGYKEGP